MQYAAHRHIVITLGLLLLAFIASTPGCKSTYYRTMEAFGHHKRDLLVDRVQETRDEQEEAKEQFRTALDAFAAVVTIENTNLKQTYNRLNDEYEDARDQAEDVSERIDSIESVAVALFEEWEEELDQYTSEELRRSSERSLRETRERYEDLIHAMHRAEDKMQPVLAAFADQVLFLKHNLNAQAIASLEGEVDDLRIEVDNLIAEMEEAIAEANAFIDAMGEAE